MKLYKRIAALAAAALMSVSLTACGDTSWVYKSGESTVTSGVYLGYLTQGYLAGKSSSNYDSEIKNIWKQQISGKSYKDFVNDYAAEACKRYIAIEQKFDELGLELTEEDQSSIETQTYYLWSLYGMEQYYQPNGTSKASFTKMVTSGIKEEKIFEAYYGEGGFEEVDKDTLIEELLDNYADINYFEMSFANDDGSVMTNAEIEDLKAKAEGYAERINSGEATLNEVMTEYEDEIAKAEAEANEEEFTATDPATIEKDEDTKSLISKDSTSPSEDFVTAVFEDIETGKATVITIDTSYYVVVKYDINDDLDNNLELARSTILNELKGEDFTALTDEWIAAVEIEENTSALHKYSPKNIEEPEA